MASDGTYACGSLVVSDVQMPHIDGFEMTVRLRTLEGEHTGRTPHATKLCYVDTVQLVHKFE